MQPENERAGKRDHLLFVRGLGDADNGSSVKTVFFI